MNKEELELFDETIRHCAPEVLNELDRETEDSDERIG